MPEFAPRQIFIAHEALWQAMERWAADHRFHLAHIPDGADETGVPFYSDDPDVTPTYAFMPEDMG